MKKIPILLCAACIACSSTNHYSRNISKTGTSHNVSFDGLPLVDVASSDHGITLMHDGKPFKGCRSEFLGFFGSNPVKQPEKDTFLLRAIRIDISKTKKYPTYRNYESVGTYKKILKGTYKGEWHQLYEYTGSITQK